MAIVFTIIVFRHYGHYFNFRKKLSLVRTRGLIQDRQKCFKNNLTAINNSNFQISKKYTYVTSLTAISLDHCENYLFYFKLNILMIE